MVRITRGAPAKPVPLSLNEPLSATALAALPPEVRARLEPAALRAEIRTLGDLVAQVDRPARDLVLAAVDRSRPRREELRHSKADALLASVGEPPSDVLGWCSVEYVQTLQHGLGGERDRIVRALETRHERRLAGWREECRRSLRHAIRPEPPLDELWTQLHAVRASFRRFALPEGESDQLTTWESTGAPGEITLSGGGTAVRVELLDEIRVRPSGPIDGQTRWGLAAIDRLLQAITDPSDPLRAVLVSLGGRSAWERGLDRFDAALRPAVRGDGPLLGWRVLWDESARQWGLRTALCTRTAKGGWSTKAVTFRNLEPGMAAELADERAIALLEGWRPNAPPEIVAIAAELLVDHPRLFSGSKGSKPLTIRRRTLALTLAADGAEISPRLTVDGEVVPIGHLRVHLADEAARTWLRLVEHPAGDELQLIPIRRETARLLAEWLKREHTLPIAALPEIVQRLPQLVERLPVQVSGALLGRRLDADLRPVVRVRWDGDVLDLEVRVRPLPELSTFEPGAGLPQLVTVRDGEPCHVERDLAGEAPQVDAALAPLELPAEARAGWRWTIHGREAALRVLSAVAEHAPAFVTSWEGAPPSFHRVSARQVKVRVGGGRGWFALDGQVEVDGKQIPLAAVLEAVREGSAFVQVRPGVFARLAEELRRSLGPVAAAADDGQLAAIHAPLVDALAAEDVAVEADPAFAASLDRLRAAATLAVPVPGELNAELRPYQRDGFAWLARLATWAPGAILADDMGLGKTVQAIALLLRRRAEGPALVVCPLSVVANWGEELARFAPSLPVAVYQGPRRAAVLENLAPGQVVLCTWDLLARDAELAQVQWGTAVLDEAQAMKNHATARAKAAAALRAGFCLAMSGTPVENRVEELWSLLRVVSPGLLGGEARFEKRFAGPIAAGIEGSREALARIVAPFVLRRTKRQVATELPERSDVVIHVALSADERALYERSRLEALVRTTEGGGQRFEVFRWLTHLRQLACHPKLVDAGSPIPSSKLEVLRRRIADLRATGHRALVFSQFVGHLALAREALLADGVSCRWLTGDTSAAARKREVDAFQAGAGDVFLISLTAGGTGLNLTAATYVFHIDPWWNPAKEDQASDRAHRIGQTQPVTVYRLVAAGTIEEKILALHAEKRELADALLAGAAAADRISTDELLAILAEEGAVAAPIRSAGGLRPPGTPRAPAPAPAAPPSWAARFRANLAEEQAMGRLSAKSVHEYARSVDKMFAWAGSEADLAATGARWLAAVAAGEAGTGTDRVFAKPAVHRLLRLAGLE